MTFPFLQPILFAPRGAIVQPARQKEVDRSRISPIGFLFLQSALFNHGESGSNQGTCLRCGIWASASVQGKDAFRPCSRFRFPLEKVKLLPLWARAAAERASPHWPLPDSFLNLRQSMKPGTSSWMEGLF